MKNNMFNLDIYNIYYVPTCKIFGDPRFPPPTLISGICPHHWLNTLLKTNSLPGLRRGVISIVSAVVVGVGVTIVAQVLVAVNQFLREEKFWKRFKHLPLFKI